MTTLDEFMAIKANAYMAVVDSWRPQTTQFKEAYDDYKRWAGAPAGTEWTGRTANAAYERAAIDCHGSDNADGTAEDAVTLATATITYEVVPNLTGGQNLVERVLEQKDRVSIDQSFNMDYHPAESESDESIARNREHVKESERLIKEYVAKWEKGCQTLKGQADTAAQKITGCINPKTALVDGRKILRDNATPKPGEGPSTVTVTSVNYKELYPKTTAPAGTQAAAVTAVDPHAPVLGPPAPGAKPPVDPSKVGGLTGNLGVMGITEPKSPVDKPPAPPDARTVPAPKLDPNTPQGKAAIDKFRSVLSTQLPPNQVEAKLADAIKGAQQDRPMVATPEPGQHERARETFSEAFHNSWDKGIKGVQDLVGANGLETAKDAWKDMGTGIKDSFGELAHPTEVTPERIDNAHRLLDNPKAFVGDQAAIAAQAVATAPLGGEAALARAGLEDAAVTGVRGELTHGLPGHPEPPAIAHHQPIDPPSGAPAEHHAPAGDAPDHHVPTIDVSPPSTSEIGDWLHEINRGPGMDPFDPARAVNCGQCALAVEQRLSGVVPDATAGHGTLSIPEMEVSTGKQQVSATPSEIAKYLVDQGAGSHTVVGVDRAGDMAGHWFNAYYDGKNVWAIDGQTNEIHGWPPDMDIPGHPVTNWDMGVPKE
ncbi:toxin glutamine deamidase domain-containing protein [Mycobacteroides salmoniphilum]|uniref:toxin glutamine deamidase domain-containing protein n=1 Tax=Mycobacteroides salmoniphilum TaxID=404941 RepID=UPI0010668096|nr:toxin glutamine deamidase domain-containing protein [Mycobacteroides salmoniphilum]